MKYEHPKVSYYIFPLLEEKEQVKLRRKKIPRQELITRIINLCCEYHEIESRQVIGKLRVREVAECRHQICWILKRAYGDSLSLKKIGSYLNNRDHSTIINSVNAVNDLIDTDKTYKMKLQHLLIVLKRDRDLHELVKNITV